MIDSQARTGERKQTGRYHSNGDSDGDGRRAKLQSNPIREAFCMVPDSLLHKKWAFEHVLTFQMIKSN